MCYGESFASLVSLEQHSENGVCWGQHLCDEVNVVLKRNHEENLDQISSFAGYTIKKTKKKPNRGINSQYQLTPSRP